MKERELVVPKEGEGKRIDQFLSRVWEDISRSKIEKLIGEEKILVNEKTTTKKHLLIVGDKIRMTETIPKEINIIPVKMDLDILYEDEYLLVVNKEKGRVVHPAPGHWEDTLVNGLMDYCKKDLSGINGELRPGIIHRIDRWTSGLLLIAKDDTTHVALSKALEEHKIVREYHAIVYGRMKAEYGIIEEPIGRNPADRKKMCVTRNGKYAKTHFWTLEELEEFSYIKLKLETGRTHQIRVHMAYQYHPVAGDEVYGPKKVLKFLQGQCLHAKVLEFTHPITGEKLRIESELPQYFTEFLGKLRRKYEQV